MMDRRPMASRDERWGTALTQSLAQRAFSPCQASLASVGFAALAAVAFYFSVQDEGVARVILLLSAAGFCQLRLICNPVDGLVPVDAGKSAWDGPFWNEAPDRLSDTLILVGLGYGLGLPALGWAAAAMAIGTAYVRELGRAATGDIDFSGPMAKPHRMAVITIAALLACLTPLLDRPLGGNGVLIVALWMVAIGALITSLRRSAAMIARLRA